MTKTPLDEFLEALAGRPVLALAVIPDVSTRAERIQAWWAAVEASAPPGTFDQETGPIMQMEDPENDGFITYEIIKYGDKRVIEAEGVVCRLLT